jgi:rhodanese-related sulfurtransferase
MSSGCIAVFLLLTSCSAARTSGAYGASELLDRYAANRNVAASWVLQSELSSEGDSGTPEMSYPRTKRLCELRWDGARVSSRCRLWLEQRPKGTMRDSGYVSLTWDGQKYTSYRQPEANKPGHVYIDDMHGFRAEQKEWEIGALQYGYDAAVLMGRYQGSLERIDVILRGSHAISVRDTTEFVNDCPCYVLDAKTSHGNYTIWLDPRHGFNIARVHILRSRDEGHLYYGQPARERLGIFVLENVRFQEVQGAWVAVEADYSSRSEEDGAKPTVSAVKSHIRITEITLNPDHAALRSFTGGDIPNGTEAFIVPVTHIRYLWKDGELVTKVDEKAVRRIDRIVARLAPADGAGRATAALAEPAEANEADLGAQAEEPKPDPRAIILPRPYCGVYCLYSALKSMGRDVGFRELVKPEYIGSGQGSTMAELSKAARDYGLFAGVAARLTTRGLSQCPYPAILHVKADLYHPTYDHYELFLGTEDGRAKLFNPPEPPRLVPFRDLAPRWDGYALALSDKPFEIDAIFGPDRQRLLMYGALGALAVVALHLVISRIPLRQGPRPRRRQLGLSGAQAAALGAAALIAGVVYHVAGREGLVANAQATASFQKAYLGGFIPKIGVRQVRRALETDTVLIDARYAEDFQTGHLTGAISLPIDANEAKWRKTMAPIPPKASIIVYCQSAGCKFAERVAGKLVEDGYSDVSVFKGGWAEWTAKNSMPGEDKRPKGKGAEPNGTTPEPGGADGT